MEWTMDELETKIMKIADQEELFKFVWMEELNSNFIQLFVLVFAF
jgi:hypothetical protein